MTLFSDTTLHSDHLRWANERALWHDDVRAWEGEIEQLEGKLQHVHAVLAQQKRNLQIHAASIRLTGESDARSEHALADVERNGNDEQGRLLANAHETAIQRQVRQSGRHDEIKSRQHWLMKTLRGLAAIADRLPPTLRCDESCHERRVKE